MINLKTLLMCLSLVLPVSVCHATYSTFVHDSKSVHTKSESVKRDKILSQYEKWKGVRYKLGGTSTSGIDCSALVQQIYHAEFMDVLQTSLPRTTLHQIHYGKQTGQADLQVGDLVFFQMSRHERHVGVYIGERKFIHASTSKGGMISDLDNRYWKKRYKTARRII